MKRVVLIRSNPVSPDPPVEKVANTLLLLGYSVMILAWERNKKGIENSYLKLQKGDVPIIRFGIPAKFGNGIKSIYQMAIFQMKIVNWLSKHRNEYDIIHSFDFDTGFIAEKYAKKYKKKLVYHILDFYAESHSFNKLSIENMIRKKEISIINSADAVVICTEKRKEQIADSHPKKLYVVYNTPQNSLVIDKNFHIYGKEDKCKIVYVGILAETRYIREIAEFVAKDTRFEFHIGGYGYLEDVVAEYGKRYSNIFYYGKLPYSKTLALESKCDIMTAIYDPDVPNHRYAAPNKFYESLMLGKPIIMVKNTGFDDVIQKNEIGCLIEYSLEGLKKGLVQLLAKKNRWSRMSEKSKKLYLQEFSWEIMERRIKHIYSDLQ